MIPYDYILSSLYYVMQLKIRVKCIDIALKCNLGNRVSARSLYDTFSIVGWNYDFERIHHRPPELRLEFPFAVVLPCCLS